MLTNQLIQLFRPIMVDGLVAAGFTNVAVLQAYQPTQQGVEVRPAIYFYHVMDHPYGGVMMSDTVTEDPDFTTHTETQEYETTFQIESLVTQDPSDVNAYTASDLVNAVAAILRSEKTRVILNAAGVGILKPQDVRNPYFLDDRDRHEAVPSFDFVLTHKQVSVSQVPVIKSINSGIFPI